MTQPIPLDILSTLTAGIAHEYNNILSIITGYTHILSRNPADDDALQKLVAIQNAAARAENFNAALLSLSASSATSCDLVSTIHQSLPLLRCMLGSRVDLRLHVPGAEIMIHQNCREVIYTILTEIAFLKHQSSQLNSLTITVTAQETQASLCIGTNPPILYPRAQEDNPFINKTVLIVDDEEAILPVLEHQLQDMGMKVLKAANADTALLLQKDYPDVIDFLLTDIVMPDVDGIELAHRITDDRPRMGVVYMTGYGLTAQLPDNSLILPKPLHPDQLSEVFRKALEQVQDA
jgi:CheY-like chemotaxis protein